MPSDSLYYYLYFDANMFISYKTQAQKLNDKIWKKMIHQKQKKKKTAGDGT